MKDKFLILAVNPGATSTKIAVYENSTPIFEALQTHSAEELERFGSVIDQFHFRKRLIVDALGGAGIRVAGLDAVVGRGGLTKPLISGIYEVNEAMVRDLLDPVAHHASNLGGLIAAEIAEEAGCKAYIADPVVVDELCPEARYTGLPQIERRSIFHALNQKRMARKYAEAHGGRYEDMNFVVAHLGGGVTVGAHLRGRVVHTNSAMDGDGPFTPERSGGLPSKSLVELCFSGRYSREEIEKMIVGRGGMVAYLGTNSMIEADRRAAGGDAAAVEVMNAMSYDIGRYIGAAAAVLRGKVDAVIITGGVAHCRRITDYIKEMVGWIAPVEIMPGENELEALADNALRVLRGATEPMIYE